MLKKQELPKNILKKILDDFNLGKIKKIEPIATSGNISYIIKTPRENYFFRLCPLRPRWRSRGEILAELEIIEHLLKNKFPVFKPVASKNGKFLISWKNHNGYIRKFLKGESKINPNLRDIENFGRTLGAFHILMERFKTKNKRTHVWDLKKTKKHFSENQKIILRSNFKNKKKFVEKFKKKINSLNFPENLPSGTIHEDLGKRHIIWKNSRIAGFIDFDRSYYGKLILDLGQACRGWCFVNNWKKWSNKNFKALINGYEKKRKMTKTERKYLKDAIKFGVLERGLAFCLRYINVTKDPEDEKYAWRSISDNGLIGMIDKNSKEIAASLK